MSKINQLFKHFFQSSLESQVVEIAKENSQQVVENNPPILTSDSLVIESLQVEQAAPSEEGSGKVQPKKIKRKNSNKKSKKGNNGV